MYFMYYINKYGRIVQNYNENKKRNANEIL
jgi:hypothetical protein